MARDALSRCKASPGGGGRHALDRPRGRRQIQETAHRPCQKEAPGLPLPIQVVVARGAPAPLGTKPIDRRRGPRTCPTHAGSRLHDLQPA
eukprot:2020986-Alexandrium_andersonii.AAC.1